MYWRSAVLAESRCVLLVRFVFVVEQHRAVLPHRVARRAHEDDGPVIVRDQLGHVFGYVDRDAFGVQPGPQRLLRDVVGSQAVAADDRRPGLFRRAGNGEGAFGLSICTGPERGAEVAVARAGSTGIHQHPHLAVVDPVVITLGIDAAAHVVGRVPAERQSALRQVAVDRGEVGVRAVRVCPLGCALAPPELASAMATAAASVVFLYCMGTSVRGWSK